MKQNMLKGALPTLKMLEGLRAQFSTNLQGKNGEKWLKEFKRYLRKEPCWTETRKMGRRIVLETEFVYLYPIQKIEIGALNGARILNGLDDLFPCGQYNFGSLGLLSPGKKTKPTEVLMYKMKKRANLSEIFYSFGCQLDDLCFNQDQIAEIIKKYPKVIEWEDNFGQGLFIFKKDEELPAEKKNTFAATVRGLSISQDNVELALAVTATTFDLNRNCEEGSVGVFGWPNDILFIPFPRRKNFVLRFFEWLRLNM